MEITMIESVMFDYLVFFLRNLLTHGAFDLERNLCAALKGKRSNSYRKIELLS